MSEDKRLYCNFDVSKLPFIGQGGQGKVYLLPDHKVIKVFKRESCCTDQLSTLQISSNSRFFPKVYDFDEYSIIIDYIDGIEIDKYLRKNPLSKKLAFELVELIREFETLGFKKLDIHLPHIFVQSNESIMVIDPRKSFKALQPYPYNMLKGLKNIGCLETFFELIKFEYPKTYQTWRTLWNSQVI